MFVKAIERGPQPHLLSRLTSKESNCAMIGTNFSSFTRLSEREVRLLKKQKISGFNYWPISLRDKTVIYIVKFEH